MGREGGGVKSSQEDDDGDEPEPTRIASSEARRRCATDVVTRYVELATVEDLQVAVFCRLLNDASIL